MLELASYAVLALLAILFFWRGVTLAQMIFRGIAGFLYGLVRFVHALLLFGNIGLGIFLVISFLFLTPGEMNATLALVAFILNALIIVRSVFSLKLWGLAIVHVPQAILFAIMAFPPVYNLFASLV